MEQWTEIRAADFIEFNPRMSIKKGTIATKVAMDKLQPFTKKIPDSEKASFSGGSKFRNGDTIMARITPCLENGKTAFVDILGKDEVAFGSTEFIVMRAREGISDPQFIYYLATSPWFRNIAIKSMVGSSGRQRVQQSVLDDLVLNVPPLEEQKKISSFLCVLDQKIALNNEINDNLQQQAQEIFRDWFLTRVEKAPENYCKVSLADLMDYAGGSQPPASMFISEPKEGYIRFVQIRDYESDSHLTYIPISSKNKLCDESDIMIARYGAALGRICFGLNGAYNVALAKVFPKQPYLREFLRCYLSSREFYEGINNKGGRSAQAGFNQSDIRSFELYIPREESMFHSFDDVVKPMFEKRLNLIKENSELAKLRDIILPKLLSGEIDVSGIQL